MPLYRNPLYFITISCLPIDAWLLLQYPAYTSEWRVMANTVIGIISLAFNTNGNIFSNGWWAKGSGNNVDHSEFSYGSYPPCCCILTHTVGDQHHIVPLRLRVILIYSLTNSTSLQGYTPGFLCPRVFFPRVCVCVCCDVGWEVMHVLTAIIHPI